MSLAIAGGKWNYTFKSFTNVLKNKVKLLQTFKIERFKDLQNLRTNLELQP